MRHMGKKKKAKIANPAAKALGELRAKSLTRARRLEISKMGTAALQAKAAARRAGAV